MAFDLEKEINEWKKNLRSYKAFDDGDIREYEQHLRDEIKALVKDELSEESAFKQAAKNLGISKEVASEISQVTQSPRTLKRVSHTMELSFLNLLPNFFKVGIRNIFRNKFYSFVNVISIAVGIVASVMILQYFLYEMNYDSFHEHADRIYRVNVTSSSPEGELNFITATNFPGASIAIREEVPAVEAAVYLVNTGTIVRRDDKIFQENNLQYSENSSVFDIFSFDLLSGNPADLDLPGTVFLSSSMAERYLEDENPLGQTIEAIDVLGNWSSFEVRGVFSDLPDNTHLQTDAFFHGSNTVRMQTDAGNFGNIPYDDIVWRLRNNYTYIKASATIDLESLEEQLNEVAVRYRGSFDARQDIITRFAAQALPNIHLTSDIRNEPSQVANPDSLYFIFAIGIATLFIGWINYVNLATARSMNRAREIGIRKVVGSSKIQLIIQFLFESILLNVLAVVLSIITIVLVIPAYHEILDLQVFDYFFSYSSQWAVFALVLISGMLLAGLYPALLFTRFKPITTLKGTFKHSSKGTRLRKSLVVFQFSLSIFLLISIFVIFSQMQHLRSLDRGVDLANTYVIGSPSLLDGNQLSRYEAFKQDLEKLPGVEKITNATAIPGQAGFPTMRVRHIGNNVEGEYILANFARVDYSYFEHFSMRLAAGRYFEEERGTEADKILINETAAELLGFASAEAALGKEIFRNVGDTVQVIGVLKDYAQRSLQHAYMPIMMQPLTERGYVSGIGPTSVKITSSDIPVTTSAIEAVYNNHFPGDIYSGVFLEDQYNQLYAAEDRFEWIFTTFTLLSILITVLGLIGLSSFMIGQRTKEIGIRKVLGSSTSQIISLITKDYFLLVLISSVVAIPFSIWWMQSWLQDFPFKIEPGALLVLIPLIIILLITLIAVSNQTIRAAIARPVKSLKTE